MKSRQGIHTFIWSTISWMLWSLIFLYAGHSRKKCWRDSVASYTGLSRNFILLSVVFRARVLVLASNFNLGDWNSTTLDKYGCLPWNIQQQKMKNSRLHFLLTQSNSLFLTKDPKNLSKVIMLISLLIQWSRPILLKTNFKLSKYFQPGEVLLCSTSMRTNLHVVLWSVAS